MSKYEPSETDLGFNPYVFDKDTYEKLNYTHYAVENLDHRRRINKWKEREDRRKEMAEALGIEYVPVPAPTEKSENSK